MDIRHSCCIFNRDTLPAIGLMEVGLKMIGGFREMKSFRAFLACLPGLLAVPLVAQPQIGGGNCSTETLSGSYSATLTGRNVIAGDTFTATTEGIGSVTFDGQSKVTFNLTTNTNKAFGVVQTLAGTYTLQANCLGVVTITSGDAATFSLAAYNEGKDYVVTGQDGTYAFTGSGSVLPVLPATCPTALTAASYPVNGTGFGLTSSALSSTFNVLGVLQLSGTNTIALNLFIASNSGTQNISSTGSYKLGTNCTGTATLTDSSGNTYSLVFEYTSSNGNNFVFSSASAGSVYTATGRAL
jgi:hypothetical protein